MMTHQDMHVFPMSGVGLLRSYVDMGSLSLHGSSWAWNAPPPPVGLTWSLRGLHDLGVRRSECLTSDLSGLIRPSGQARDPCYPSIPTGYTWLKMLLNNVNNNSSKTNYACTYQPTYKAKIGRNWHFIRNQHRTLCRRACCYGWTLSRNIKYLFPVLYPVHISMQLQSRHTTEQTEIYSIKHLNSCTHAEILFRNTSNIGTRLYRRGPCPAYRAR